MLFNSLIIFEMILNKILGSGKFHVRFKYKHVLGIFIYVQVAVYAHNLSDVKFTSF